ncbi:MAG: hypothetical protein HGA78_06975 [Nitrospirales bacterium]|nr:hypothetical protein [Nitrospirales bacterium]
MGDLAVRASRLKRAGIFLFILVMIAGMLSTQTLPSESASSPFDIVEPMDRSSLAGQFLTMVLRVTDKGIDTITVELNEKKKSSAPKTEYLCFGGLELSPGLNTITVTAGSKGKIVQTASLSVFRVVAVSQELQSPPPGFGRLTFHVKQKEEACRSCHRMDPRESDLAPSSPEDSLCYACHKGITAFPNVHGPAAVWGCLSCHENKSEPVRYGIKNPSRDICFTCHKDTEEDWAQKGFVHGPTATGNCTICHSPHASDNIFWLRKPIWDLCVSCHEEKATETHVVAGFVFGATHPTKGRPDPVRNGRDLSCSSCHNPHTSDSRLFFLNSADSAAGLCQMCHKK